jgi:flagellar biosynthesis protein FliQ
MDLNLIISGFLIGLVITIFGMVFRIRNFTLKDNLKKTIKETVLFVILYPTMIFLLNLFVSL